MLQTLLGRKKYEEAMSDEQSHSFHWITVTRNVSFLVTMTGLKPTLHYK